MVFGALSVVAISMAAGQVVKPVVTTTLPAPVVAGATDGTLLLRDADSLVVLGPHGEFERVAVKLHHDDVAAVAPGGQWLAVVGVQGDVSLYARAKDRLVKRAAWSGAANPFAPPLFADGRLVTLHGQIEVRSLADPGALPSCVLPSLQIGPIREAFDLGQGLVAVHGDHVDSRSGAHRTMPALVDLRSCKKVGRLSHHERYPAAAGGTRVMRGPVELFINTADGTVAAEYAGADRVRLAVSPDGSRVSVSELGQVEVFDLRRKMKTSFPTMTERVTVLADDGAQLVAALGTERLVWTASSSLWEPFKVRKVLPDEVAWLAALSMLGEGRADEALRRTRAVSASSTKLELGFIWVDAVANRLSDQALDARLRTAGIDLRQTRSQKAALEVLQDFVLGELKGNGRDLLFMLSRFTIAEALRPQVVSLGRDLVSEASDARALKENVKLLELLERLHPTPEVKRMLELERLGLEESESSKP